MEDLLTYVAVLSAVLYVVIAIQLYFRLGSQVVAILPALVYMSLWSLYSTSNVRLDFILVALWLSGFLYLLKSNGAIGAGVNASVVVWGLPMLALAGALLAPVLPSVFVVYPILIFMVALLMITELVIRTMHGSLRALSIAIGTLFLFQVYFYAQMIATGRLPIELLGARILLSGAISILLVLTPVYIKNDFKVIRQIGLSRPMAFTTTSLLFAGLIITFIAVLSFVLETQVGEYRKMFQPFFVFLCILLIGFNLGSSSQRARTRVWINKHFFETKHDYNKEWKNLSDRLSAADAENFESVALAATMAIFHATSGVVYTRHARQFVPRVSQQVPRDTRAFNDSEHDQFLQKAGDGWIFVKGVANSSITESFDMVPAEINELGDALVVVPLIRNLELISLIVFEPAALHLQNFDWEDLDLLKKVAKQVSNFVAFQMLAQDKAVKQQFEAYHQFTTFVMHDLKNLIAQQELVVQNAGRFKDNPEFIDDAITTIDNSVKKMNRIMSKINEHSLLENGEAEVSLVLLDEVIDDALLKVRQREPTPVVTFKEHGLLVQANRDSITMAITHMINNAQDACEDSDTISVELRRSGSGDSAICSISDTGVGMDPEFVENRLFKPFDSTNKTVGMGIGAYQSREIISKIGGHIVVDSTLGVGSCFTITLPLTPA